MSDYGWIGFVLFFALAGAGYWFLMGGKEKFGKGKGGGAGKVPKDTDKK